jgi:flagellar motor switch protein FliN/FliY
MKELKSDRRKRMETERQEMKNGKEEKLNLEFSEAILKENPRLEFILDLPIEVSVELGRTKILISELLQLGQGSIIELNKLAGEPLEILVNQKLVARGEAVVVNEKFGVRLTDIISPVERVKQLGGRSE